LATNWDLDERYFYYLAFIQESNSSFLCKRELDGGYEKRASSAMIFNKASRRAMTIHPQNNLDRQPPVLIVQPENPRCNADQVLALQTAPREKFPINNGIDVQDLLLIENRTLDANVFLAANGIQNLIDMIVGSTIFLGMGELGAHLGYKIGQQTGTSLHFEGIRFGGQFGFGACASMFFDLSHLSLAVGT
uniref:Uncharacterized protein n=1 Tax=Romanomermis culicivorax TaxID=13658 RepID=A0A915HY49_ROMCU